MKRYAMTCIALATCLGAGVAHAQVDGSLNRFRNHALPVLVRVNTHGKVTEVLPSVELSPRTDRLLRANLDQMITRPAMRHGHAVRSQFVIHLALVKQKQGDGTYLAHFRYVSSLPVPAGSWYWVRIDGHQLALAEDDVHGVRKYLPTFRPRWHERLPDMSNQNTVPATAAPPTMFGGGQVPDSRVSPRTGGR